MSLPLAHLNDILSEHLECYVLVGYGIDGEEYSFYMYKSIRDQRALASALAEASEEHSPQYERADLE